MKTLLEKFNLSSDLFATMGDSPEAFESNSRTTTLHVGRRVPFKGSINGVEVQAFATVNEASLTRLSVIQQTSPYDSSNQYKIVTGIFKPVKMTVEVVVDGETMTIQELLRSFVNASSANQIDEQTFLDTASKIGLKFTDGMPLLFQQFGASEDGIAHAIATFKQAGAYDALGAMTKKSTNLIEAYAHDTGVPVTSFEVGSVDRNASRTGQGFLNLVDATVDQFNRIVSLRKEASVLKSEIATQTNWSQSKVTQAETRVKKLQEMSRQWTTNWAGAQQIIRIDGSGKKVAEDQYAAVNAPCGRFQLLIDGKKVSIDLWKNSLVSDSQSVSEPTPTVVNNELPF
jgi:hypothetical protein